MNSGVRTLAATLLLALSLTTPAAKAVEDNEFNLVDDLLNKQAAIKTLEAEFVQKRTLRTMTRPLSSEGRILYSSDGPKLLMEVGKPVRKLIKVEDGKALIIDMAKQTGERRQTSGEGMQEAALFFRIPIAKDTEELQQRFTIESVANESGVITLVLIPKNDQLSRYVKQMTMKFTERSGLLREYELSFSDRSEFSMTFTKTTANKGIEDAAFAVDTSGIAISKPDGT